MDAAPQAAPAGSAAAHLVRAIEIAAANVHRAGGPFGAVVVASDGRIFEGVNRVTADLDPTAHAEVSAIRAACRALGTFDLTGAVLYTSCEPCPMCLAAALWARIARVHFAANRDDAADAGFDDALFYRYFEADAADRSFMPVEQLALPAEVRIAPFTEWGRIAARTQY